MDNLLKLLGKLFLSLIQKKPELQISIPFGTQDPPNPKFVLTRKRIIPDGIVGILVGDNGFNCATLERTWEGLPKVPGGNYICIRGLFRLEGQTSLQSYFQITNVPNHTDILFHPANYITDLNGCVGLGTEGSNPNMICESRITFQSFMSSLQNTNSFELTVVNQ